MSTVTVWLLVLVTNSGHRVELPRQYMVVSDCIAAAQSIESGHAGTKATCLATTITVSEERARQLANDEWRRSRAADNEGAKNSRP